MKKWFVWTLVMTLLLSGSGIRMQAQEEIPVPEEEIVLMVMDSGDSSGAACALQALHGVRVQFSEESDETLEAQLAAENTKYDVIRIDYSFGCSYTADDWMQKGYFAELKRPIVSEAVQSMWPGLQQIAVFENKTYALPVAARPYVLKTWNKRYYSDWQTLMESEGFLEKDDGIVWACLLEQYMLGAQSDGFTFDNQSFMHTLRLANKAYHAQHQIGCGVEIPQVALGVKAQIQQISCFAVEAHAERLGWLPSLDGKWQIPMKASVLAIPAHAPHARQAQDFVAEAASIGLYGTLSHGDKLSFGGEETAACYDRTLQMVWTVGEDAENLDRWRQIMQHALVTPYAGFLTECLQKEIGDYFDGKINEERCAQAVQHRWESLREK